MLGAHVRTQTQSLSVTAETVSERQLQFNTSLTNRRFVGKQTILICRDKYVISLHLLAQEGPCLRTSTLARSHLVRHERGNSVPNI
jgi:hypothetical protein